MLGVGQSSAEWPSFILFNGDVQWLSVVPAEWSSAFFYRSMFDVQRGLGPAEWSFPFCSVSNVQRVSAKVRPNGHLSYCPVLDAESVC